MKRLVIVVDTDDQGAGNAALVAATCAAEEHGAIYRAYIAEPTAEQKALLARWSASA